MNSQSINHFSIIESDEQRNINIAEPRTSTMTLAGSRNNYIQLGRALRMANHWEVVDKSVVKDENESPIITIIIRSKDNPNVLRGVCSRVTMSGTRTWQSFYVKQGGNGEYLLGDIHPIVNRCHAVTRSKNSIAQPIDKFSILALKLCGFTFDVLARNKYAATSLINTGYRAEGENR